MKMKDKIVVYVFCSIILILLGSGIMYYLVTEKKLFSQTIVNKLEKEVTINENGIADAVEKVYDSVVVIFAYQKNATSGGTGFVYKVEGNKAYILTNAHVIADAEKVKVKFTNNNIYDVEIVGFDKYSDIGVLAIDKDKIISVAEIGSSNNARLGDTLFTVGSPVDADNYSWTVTRGILSGKNRLVEVNASNYDYDDWVIRVIQTDAAINSGNSGGPIANSNGQVVGITNMKLSTYGVEGMSFAIPIEDAKEIAEGLIKNNKIERPLLGVGTININNAKVLYQYGFTIDSSITEGAIIGKVEKDTPAEKAGLKVGDIIIKIDDYKITNRSYLKYYLYKYKIGDTINVTYLRNGKEESVKVKLTKTA